MLQQPLLDKLSVLRLSGLRKGLEEQAQSPHYAELSFEERLGLLIDREWVRRENARLSRGTRLARFHQNACVEDLDLSPSRGIDRRLVLELAQGDWIRNHLNVVVLGPTGSGKTYLACALGQAACRLGMSVRYMRASRLLQDFAHAHADGSYPKFLDTLSRTSLLVIDDWLRDALNAQQARDLLEILDDRYGRHSLLVASQVPVAQWHERIPDPTIADALLDRLVHNAYRLEFNSHVESQRKIRSPLQEGSP